MKSLIETALAGRGPDARDELSWLANRLLRHSPATLWQILRARANAEVRDLVDRDTLMTALGHALIADRQLAAAAELLASAPRWHVQLDGTVARRLAEAYAAAGATPEAEAVLRDILSGQPDDREAVRLLYKLVKADGRTTQAHELLNTAVDLDPSMAMAAFAYRERAKLGAGVGDTARIALLSSYVAEPLAMFLDVECRRAGLNPSIYVGAFNQYAQEILSPSSELYASDPEVVFLAVGLEDIFPGIWRLPSVAELDGGRGEIVETITALVRELRARTKALIVVHEFFLRAFSPNGILDSRQANSLSGWVETLNRELAERLAAEDVFLLPLRQVLTRVGTTHGLDPKLRVMARVPLAAPALHEIARYSLRYVKPLKGLTRKCVVLDLDGTLWGGIVGEVGPDGIQLGPTAPGVEFVEFQEALLNLTKRGILLAVCSKNNPDDVLPVLRHHPSMVLREEHLSALRVNWRNKADNLRDIADELNIGLDALVFIDDNPHERELIRQVMPEVLTVELPRDPAQFRRVLEDLSDFELLALTNEDEIRVAEYQGARKRKALERSSASLGDYLHSLGIKAEVTRAAAAQIPRLAQLFNKTNQFNTTTRRYQAADVERFVRSDAHHVYVLRVTDRFGDHGLVGAAVVREEGATWRIDSLLLSCRVMGFSVETALLAHVEAAARARAVHRLIGDFLPTAKNRPAEDLYRRHGFRPIESGVGSAWELDLGCAEIKTPTWIKVAGE
jgi:FkbH-like protein